MVGCIAFEGDRVIGSGPLAEVALDAKRVVDRVGHETVLIFDAQTSEPIELDLRGTAADVKRRLGVGVAPVRRAPGRPKLGVVAREVTLLPRHWEWLAGQPGGASVSLRKLVEQARQVSGPRDQRRAAQESAYRFMVAMAGNHPGFEEATRALFAGDPVRFAQLTKGWPTDVRSHVRHLAGPALADR